MSPVNGYDTLTNCAGAGGANTRQAGLAHNERGWELFDPSLATPACKTRAAPCRPDPVSDFSWQRAPRYAQSSR